MGKQGREKPDTEYWTGNYHRCTKLHPDFKFIAEVYWDLEWTLHNWVRLRYDKRLTNGSCMKMQRASGCNCWQTSITGKAGRFIENHDETRAAARSPTVKIMPPPFSVHTPAQRY
jgi:hypothetical protein